MSQKSIIDIIKDNSLNIYDALNTKKISIDEIYKIIKNNKKKLNYMLKLLNKMIILLL